MDTLNRPLDFNAECWDLFSSDSDQYEQDWEDTASYCAAENVDPSTINAFEVKS